MLPNEPLESMANQLEASGDYRVLRRFKPPSAYGATTPNSKLRKLLVIDTETTGLDKKKDKIIEIGYVIVHFDPETGAILDVVRRFSGFEDPGFPLPENITQITGITDQDVAGQKFDDDQINADIAESDLVVAHNAGFDRGFLELRFEAFKLKWWACSQKEGPWKEMLTGSAKLEFLASMLSGIFYDAHRALTDAEVLLHILASTQYQGASVFKFLMDKARQKTYRVWAEGAPYDKKDVLKVENAYKWSDGTDPDSPIKAWYKDGIVDLQVELDMLATKIYGRPQTITLDELTGRDRFTERQTRRQSILIEPQ